MDFSFTEEQHDLQELAARIIGDLSTHERLKEIERTGERIDRKLWSELAAAGLLEVSLPEDAGGAGLGFMAAGIVAEEVGRAAAAVPYVAAVVLGAETIARRAPVALRSRLLPPALAGELLLSAALVEPGGDPRRPTTRATHQDGAWRLRGTKTCVAAGMVADAVVVPAVTDSGGVALFVVDLDSPGVTRRRQETTSGQLEAELDLEDVEVEAEGVVEAGAGAAEGLEDLLARASTAWCLQIAGACRSAVQLTAEYTARRQQFGKAIATFQAVGQRAADAYIDAEAVHLTAWQAAWRLAKGLPAAREVAVAKYWADEGAQRVVHAAQHLHGGMGVDRDYPLHRHYLQVKHLALTLGGTTPSLLRLGDLLAAEQV